MNNDLYRRLFTDAPFGYSYQKIILDEKGKAIDAQYLEVNTVFEKIFGLKSENILHRDAAEISLESNIDDLKQIELFKDAALNGHEHLYEYFSEYTQKKYNVQVYSVEKGFFSRVFIEIPKEKNDGYASTAQEDKYYRLIEFSVDAFFHVDREGHFITVNSAAEESTGYSRDELLKMNILDMFPEDTLKNKPLRFDLLQTGETLITERDAKKKNGEIIPIEMHSKKMPDGSYQAFVRDITLRKSAEKKLMLYQEALDSSTDAIGMSTPEGKHYYQNTSFTHLFGDIGEYPPDTLYVDKKIGDAVFKTIMAGERWTGEVEMYAKDKSILKILLRAYAGKDSSGRITALVGIHTDITERYQAEIALMQSNKRLVSIIEATRIATWEWNVQTGELVVNNRWAEIIGYTLDEISPVSIKTWEKYAHPDDLKLSDELLNKHFSKELSYYEFESRMLHKDGSWVWVLDRGKVFSWSDDGKPLMMFGTHQEITQRKKSEEALKLERSQLLSIFDSIDEVIYVTDPYTYEVLFANQAMKKAFNRELIGGICYQEFQGLDAPCPFCTNEIILCQKPEPYCWEYHNPTVNTDYAIVDRIIKWTDGRDVRFELAINITERKRVEKQLVEKNQFISSLLRAIPVAVFYKDKEGRYLGCNNLFSEIMGVTSSEIQGKTVYELWPGELAEVYHQKDIEIINNPHYQSYEFKVKDKNGQVRDAIFAKDAFFDANSDVAGLVGAFLDITDRKKIEKELIHAKEKAEESDRLKSAFLANLSHEIRTPMNAILGFTELLKISELTAEKKEHYIDTILKSGRRLLSIISDIIEISKIDAGQMKLNYSTIDINSLLVDLYNEINVTIPNNKNVMLQILEAKPNLKIISDEVKLKQILTNLITNAVKFTDNGLITFGCKEVFQDKGLLEFIVRDTGCGIDKKYHQTIFERFRQGEGDLTIIKGGSGLGLAISKSYVEMLGGTISVESELGKGSLFTFTILLQMAEQIPVQADEQETLSTVKHQKLLPILIAEDDEDNYYFIQEIMKLEDFPIIRAKNGQEAVDICRTNDNIRVVLMDIQMPVMDGYAALKEIRKLRSGLTIIAQTAFALSGDKEHILSAGFDGYITKPINIPELIKILNSCNRA